MSNENPIQPNDAENFGQDISGPAKHEPPDAKSDVGRFYLPVDGHEVVIRYQLKGDDQIDLQSTYTPPELRRQGLARKLVNQVLDYAQAKGLEVIPTCWYVQKVIEERQSGAEAG